MGLFDALMPKKEKELKFAAKEKPASKKTSEKAVKSDYRDKAETHKAVAFQRNEKPVVPRAHKLGVCVPEHAKNRTETYSYDPNVCVPIHARPAEERRKLNRKNEVSPFEKLKIQHEKDEEEFDKELDDLAAQSSDSSDGPFEIEDDAPREGAEVVQRRPLRTEEEVEPQIKPRISIDPKRKAELESVVRSVMYGKGGANNPSANIPVSTAPKKDWKKAMPNFEMPQKEEPVDEIEESIDKVEGYVPKFSNSARKKFASSAEARGVGLEPKGSGTFEVTGVYQGGDTTIISGHVTSGKITSRLTAQKGSLSIRLNELKRGVESVSELRAGEQGSLFVRGSVAAVKYGDTLDFS